MKIPVLCKDKTAKSSVLFRLLNWVSFQNYIFLKNKLFKQKYPKYFQQVGTNHFAAVSPTHFLMGGGFSVLCADSVPPNINCRFSPLFQLTAVYVSRDKLPVLDHFRFRHAPLFDGHLEQRIYNEDDNK